MTMRDAGPKTAIRPAGSADLEGVRALLAAAQLPVEGLEDQFGPPYAVAERASGLVGAAGMEVYGRAGLLRSVVVAAAERGTGLGRALAADRLAWARAQGLEEVYLLTTTAADFFARLGFERVAREGVPPAIRASREFASVCPSTAVVMRVGL
jgi:amino-acid N-acetyltransferase